MAGNVISYETKQKKYGPHELHGVKEAKLLLIQCTNKKRNAIVLIGIESAPGVISVFPEDTWARMGEPQEWLKKKIDAVYYKKTAPKQEAKESSQLAEEAEVVVADGVSV